ncbi:MAG: response regulator [Desulfomonile tiedjei]|nr:response regulator [Desulfomonile tiedjei]
MNRAENDRITVVIADHSPVMGMQIARMLAEDEAIEVLGRVRTGAEALAMVSELCPKVVTLDAEMPDMAAFAILKRLMVKHPVPTVLLSALDGDASSEVFDAIRYGAVDVLAKPSPSSPESLEFQKRDLIRGVRRAAAADIEKCHYRRLAATKRPWGKFGKGPAGSATRFIGVGAGGGEFFSVFRVVTALPEYFQDVLMILLDVSPRLAGPFATHLQRYSLIPVVRFERSTIVERGVCYVATFADRPALAGHFPNELELRGSSTAADLQPSSPLDAFLISLAAAAGNCSAGVMMSGPGEDGVKGMLEIERVGGLLAAQDPANCMDPSRSRALLGTDAAVELLPDYRMSDFLVREPDVETADAGAPESQADSSAAVPFQSVDLLEHLRFLLTSRQAKVLEVRSESGTVAEIFVRGGNVVHAVCGDLQGLHALRRCLSFKAATLSDRPWEEPAESTVDKLGALALMEAARTKTQELPRIIRSEE